MHCDVFVAIADQEGAVCLEGRCLVMAIIHLAIAKRTPEAPLRAVQRVAHFVCK